MEEYAEFNNFHKGQVNKIFGSKSLKSRTPVDTVTEYQYALERLADAKAGRANPPFKLSQPVNRYVDSPTNKILRGYIRRSDIDAADETSSYRLYFMFNPEQIQRNYMAYLDQQALDPYNTLFGSNNMSAPPGILDFSFDLLFDRQLEVATDPDHVGTKVDYDYFDIVVRGVVPDANNNGNSIPDNGIMMMNPRNIAVVFGPDLAVHGRPYNSSVRFEKFNHKMVPIRMTISIVMKAFYIGPVSTIPNYGDFNSESIFEATIPYDENLQYEAIFVDVDQAALTDSPSTTTESGFPAPYVQNPALSTGPNAAVFNTQGIQLTEDQMADLVVGSGLRGEAAAIAIAIAYRESRFNSGSANTSGLDLSYGLFQFNMHPGAYGNSLGTKEQLMTPAYAMQKFVEQSKGGTYFKPWYITPDGQPTYPGYDLKFIDQARRLVQARGAYA